MKVLLILWAIGALGAVMAAAEADTKVYRAVHPHWWDAPQYSCWTFGGDNVSCLSGAWIIPKLRTRASESLAASGMGLAYEDGRRGFAIKTFFARRHDTLTLHCKGMRDTKERKLMTQEWEAQGKSGRNFTYAVSGLSPSELDRCLSRPITMKVDGRSFRLDTSRLRKALEKAIHRAE